MDYVISYETAQNWATLTVLGFSSHALSVANLVYTLWLVLRLRDADHPNGTGGKNAHLEASRRDMDQSEMVHSWQVLA